MSDNGSIVGKVINQQDGLPILDATLELDGSSTTTSGKSGDFQFDDLAPGSYDLTARKSGFEDGLYGPLVVIAGVATEIMIALAPPPP